MGVRSLRCAMCLTLVLGVLPALAAAQGDAASANGAEPTPEQTQFDFANGLFHRGFFEEAAEEYTRYLESYPGGPNGLTATYRLGKAAFAAKKYEQALEAYGKVLEAGGGEEAMRLQAALGRGEALYFMGRVEEAVKELASMAGEDAPADVRARALYYLGRARHALGEYESAVDALKLLLDGMPGDALAPFARYQLAFVYLDRNEPENAAIEFSAVATSKAEQALRMESRFRAAEIYDKIGWFSAAVGAYEQLRKEFPESAYARRADYGYAWALYHAGKFAEALVAAESFAKAHPESPYLLGLDYLRGNCLQQQKQYEQALAVYTAIREKHPDSPFAPRAAYKTAWVQYLMGDTSAARKGVASFLQNHKDSPLVGDAGFLLGTLLVAEGNYEDAHQEFRLVAEKYPDSEFGAEALYKSAECLSQLGMTDQAASSFEQFVKRYPDNLLTEEAILRAADAQFDAKDFAPAVEKYTQILKNPVDPLVEQDTLYRLAITYHNMKDYKSSADTFRKLLEKKPAAARRAESLFRIAEYLLREESDSLKAMETYQEALEADPKGAFAGRALRGLALARYERKDYDMAAEQFLRLMKEYPDVSLNEDAFAWAGQRFFDQEKWDESARAFTALLVAVKGYPNPERVRFKIAECAEQSGDADKALERYQAVVEAAPGSTTAVEATFRMAQLHESREEMERASELYESAANTNNGDVAARARFRLGEIQEGREEYDLAARSFMRVAILFLHEELSPKALWRAGQCFEKAGANERARKAYDEILSDYPESAPAAEAKEALGKLQATQ